MRKALSVVSKILALIAAAHTSRGADQTWELSVQASASLQSTPPSITLSWPADKFRPANSYTISRKALNGSTWGSGTTLPGNSVSFKDTNVAPGVAYEYQILKKTAHYAGYGYVCAGINLPLIEDRGRVILVVENTYASDLAHELGRLQQDLVGDGWAVSRIDVSRDESVTRVKDLIKAQYEADPANTSAVFLFGHVPVPYSGDIVPDGHAPDHQGAWPCDGYYGDMEGLWTDVVVNDTKASDPRNHNVPGDGKFDQSTFPAALKLLVGRVDLASMPGRLKFGGEPTFPNELELLRNYLNKDHNFRHKNFDLPRRGLVGDYFGYRDGEAFAASGWRNLAAFFGSDNIEALPREGTWVPTLSTNAYLCAYGCGPGSYTSIGGIGNSDSYNDGVTPEFYQNDLKAVFTMLFGSWLGDWDSEDNLQRSVLALRSYGLTCVLSGRPHWFMHHMAAGMPIGYSARLTQNNKAKGLYQTQVNNCANQVHIALMGDPTLRLHTVAPPTRLQGAPVSGNVTLQWNPSTDDVLGYHVYRAKSPLGPFTRLSAAPVIANTFTDATPTAEATYMVRAVKLERSASATYQNASQGAFVTISDAANYVEAGTNTPAVDRRHASLSKSSSSTLMGSSADGAPLTPTGSLVPNSTVWVDDTLPAGAVAGASPSEAWTWINNNPPPVSGVLSHESAAAAGLHEHYFSWAVQTLPVAVGDTLFAYVYLDPANPPSEVMLQWFDGSWDHRAYWGANNITYGTEGTSGRRSAGRLPAAGQWVRLEVPASQVGLEGRSVSGMAFSLFNGRAAWDYAGTVPTASLNGSGSTTTPTNSTSTVTSANDVAWVEDALPAGAQPGADGGDSWSWINTNPAPYSGALAHESSAAAGLHQHYFSFSGQTLTVKTGDVMYAWVYLDPTTPPSALMLQWNDGTWEHRAYWGANLINYGVDGTVNRRYAGSLPSADKWVRLEVPAAQVGLEGSTLSGMAFSVFNGRAVWDTTGKSSASQTNTPGTSTNSVPVGTVTNTTTSLTNVLVWLDDSVPTGAQTAADGGDAWTWISSNPAPLSGGAAHQSSVNAGLHQHYFAWATRTMEVAPGDILFANVYLDPSSPPSQLMVQWYDGSWEHRAFWGANNINYGTDNTDSRRYMGALPAVGKWVRLEVPASKVGLEGCSVNGMSFSQLDGRATWDYVGKGSAVASNPSTPTNTPPPTSTNSTSTVTSVGWVDDNLPTGAQAGAEGGDGWNWLTTSQPVSGTRVHQSNSGVGVHQHYFAYAAQTLTVNQGDVLFAYVWLDGGAVPSEVMLQWYDGSWEHRAYWGENRVSLGTEGTVSRRYMGPLPTGGRWVRLQVPAADVGLDGSTLNGMAFTLVDGRATWDLAGKSSGLVTPDNPGSTTTNPPPVTGTNQPPVTNTNQPPVTSTNTTPPPTNSTIVTSTNNLPGSSRIDYIGLELPQVGDTALHVLAPNLLELKLINTKQTDPARVSQWDLVDSNSQFIAPPAGAFTVTANGSPVAVTSVGFKRRPIWAPIATYDLRIENSLYLQLASPVSDQQVVEVKNDNGALWPATTKYVATVDPLRYSPAIHVNQEGYMPGYAKKAMVGYYAGSLGEMTVPASAGFKVVDANTGAQVFQGPLSQRLDSGYTYSPTPYQKVYEADFTGFNTPGQYRLVVPGLGASLPFVVSEGIAMSFSRAYALGLYHQRCGTATKMPFTRHAHDICHTTPTSVPSDAATYPFTWNTVAGYANTINNNNPPQIAPALTSPANQLFPFIRQGTFDTSGGHHDAGDYSKYTANSASLVHYLMFAADSLNGVAALDNLGIPESGDGISDILQEAKWEADFLAKLQDTDGGFYFLVYPKNREYEGDVTPDKGDAQVVWPKTTSVTAASVAALAQCASSPKFKQAFPAVAAAYLEKAKLGWQFLMNAIGKYGKNGAYQKITHYADDFADNDELAWAAAEMFLATGDQTIHQLLKNWFDPSNPATWRWGWWRMSQCWGHAIRSYAFAVRSGRVSASDLDAAYLAKCEAQVTAAGDDVVKWHDQSAYGSSFPENTKHVLAAGWYFSTDQAFDMAVAYQLNPKSQYITALIDNMNFEAGCNPVNVTYVTGLGWKRQRDVVSQWAVNDSRVLPPSGEPVGNITASFGYMWNYGGMLNSLSFPADAAATAPYPFYDRWGDSWNVNAEFVVLNSARSLGALSFLAAQTSLKTQTWKAPSGATITVPGGVAPLGKPVTVSLQVPGMDTRGARITWEARDQEPAFGNTFTFVPRNNGTQWVEAEAQWPDGRRVFATATFSANSPDIVWFDDALPQGAVPGSDGGDSWNWSESNPVPKSGSKAHTSATAAGAHQHYFDNATATLTIDAGDVLYTWVHLDPASPPTEIMLQWNDGTWDHRAYWGANQLSYGIDGTPGKVYMGALPAAGQWVQLKVPASKVGLEGRILKGMAFSLFGGRAIWDTAGRLNTSVGTLVAVTSPTTVLSRTEKDPGLVTFTRSGDTTGELSVNYLLAGTAVNGVDYEINPGGTLAASVTIPAGQNSTTLTVQPKPTTNIVLGQSLVVSVASANNYFVGNPGAVELGLSGNTVRSSLRMANLGPLVSWPSTSNRSYQIAYKDRLDDPKWIPAGQVKAQGNSSAWLDLSSTKANQRFYLVAQID